MALFTLVGPEPVHWGHDSDAQHIAADLHSLLERSRMSGSNVFVGHSLGGLFVCEYAAQYPDDIAGVVLIDATHPDLWQRLPPELGLPPDWQLEGPAS